MKLLRKVYRCWMVPLFCPGDDILCGVCVCLWCLCVCMCIMHFPECADALVCKHACVCQKSTSGFFPQESSTRVLRQGLSLAWILPSSLGYLASRAQGIHLSPSSQHWDYRRLPHAQFFFSHHSWGSNSGTNVHIAAPLLTVLAPRSPCLDSGICVWLVLENLGLPLMKNSGAYYSFSCFSLKFQFPRSH